MHGIPHISRDPCTWAHYHTRWRAPRPPRAVCGGTADARSLLPQAQAEAQRRHPKPEAEVPAGRAGFDITAFAGGAPDPVSAEAAKPAPGTAPPARGTPDQPWPPAERWNGVTHPRCEEEMRMIGEPHTWWPWW